MAPAQAIVDDAAPMAREGREGRRRSPWRRVALGAQNALEILRVGRLSEPYRAPFETVHADRTYRLRRYAPDKASTVERLGAPLLLVPPLMVTSEIYDLEAENSAVTALGEAQRELGIEVTVMVETFSRRSVHEVVWKGEELLNSHGLDMLRVPISNPWL